MRQQAAEIESLMAQHPYTLADVIKITGLTKNQLKAYIKQEVIAPFQGAVQAKRYFSEEDVQRLKRAKELGVNLNLTTTNVAKLIKRESEGKQETEQITPLQELTERTKKLGGTLHLPIEEILKVLDYDPTTLLILLEYTSGNGTWADIAEKLGITEDEVRSKYITARALIGDLTIQKMLSSPSERQPT